MQRRVVAGLVSVPLVLVLAAGCGSDSGGSGRHSDVAVTGTATVSGAPDTLAADLGVQVDGSDVSGAINTANSRIQAVIDAVTAAGVAAKDVRTTDVSLQPQYSSDGSTPTGYRAVETVHIVVRDLSKASTVLAAAVHGGGDAARIDGVSFAISDDTKLLADARSRAFADAKAKAEQYASLSGRTLGQVLTIAEHGGSEPSPGNFRLETPVSPVPIAPGDQTISFTVDAKWALD
jgi:uncharacterized protein YggE